MKKQNMCAMASVGVLSALVACSGATQENSAQENPPPTQQQAAAVQDGEVFYVDGPQFDSVEALDKSSDVVVKGVFGRHTKNAVEADLISDAPLGLLAYR